MAIVLNYAMWKQIIPMLKSRTVKLTPEENDDLFLQDMRGALKKKYSKERSGVHVSDLVGCAKRKVYEHIDPQDVSENQLLYYVTGAAVHGVKQDLVGNIDGEKYSVEKLVKYRDKLLEGHIDLFNNEMKMPIEMKTARMTSDQLISKGANDTYLVQLAMYMALTNTDKGLLEYILLSSEIRRILSWIYINSK